MIHNGFISNAMLAINAFLFVSPARLAWSWKKACADVERHIVSSKAMFDMIDIWHLHASGYGLERLPWAHDRIITRVGATDASAVVDFCHVEQHVLVFQDKATSNVYACEHASLHEFFVATVPSPLEGEEAGLLFLRARGSC